MYYSLFISLVWPLLLSSFFFFNATAPTEIYTLSLQRRSSDLLFRSPGTTDGGAVADVIRVGQILAEQDRKSTRLNSSHVSISYAVFCLKKKSATWICLIPEPHRSFFARRSSTTSSA